METDVGEMIENNHRENTKRIAKNTLMLYVRMLFSMLVSLYTSRVVLQALGVEDYGINNVVGGLALRAFVRRLCYCHCLQSFHVGFCQSSQMP